MSDVRLLLLIVSDTGALGPGAADVLPTFEGAGGARYGAKPRASRRRLLASTPGFFTRGGGSRASRATTAPEHCRPRRGSPGAFHFYNIFFGSAAIYWGDNSFFGTGWATTFRMLPQVHPSALRNKPIGWRKYQPVVFTAILIGFPLSNVLLFFCTQMFPLVRTNSPAHPFQKKKK